MIAFGEGGDRIINYGLYNWLPERRGWVPVGTYNSVVGLNITPDLTELTTKSTLITTAINS